MCAKGCDLYVLCWVIPNCYVLFLVWVIMFRIAFVKIFLYNLQVRFQVFWNFLRILFRIFIAFSGNGFVIGILSCVKVVCVAVLYALCMCFMWELWFFCLFAFRLLLEVFVLILLQSVLYIVHSVCSVFRVRLAILYGCR